MLLPEGPDGPEVVGEAVVGSVGPAVVGGAGVGSVGPAVLGADPPSLASPMT